MFKAVVLVLENRPSSRIDTTDTKSEPLRELSAQLSPDYAPVWRNLAIAHYSHCDQREEALSLLKKALALDSANDQIVYETVLVMAKLGVAAEERLAFLESHASKDILRDDIVIEWARALNQAEQPEAALELLKHEFASCEGGEHAVAEQYLIALHQLGRRAMQEENHIAAIEFFQQAQQPLPPHGFSVRFLGCLEFLLSIFALIELKYPSWAFSFYSSLQGMILLKGILLR